MTYKIFVYTNDPIKVIKSPELIKKIYVNSLYLPGVKGDKGETGDTGSSIIEAEFSGNDIIFTKTDDTEVILYNAKTELKGDKGDKGDTGEKGEQGETGEKGATGEPGIGIAIGGNTGQILTKNSNDDYDTTWSDPASPVAGNNGEVQFNNNGVLGADSNLFWDNINKNLGIKVSNPLYSLCVNGTGYFNSILTEITQGGFIEIGGNRFAGAVSIPVASTTTIGGLESAWLQTGAYQNYLRYTEQFEVQTAGNWIRTNITNVVANSYPAPIETAVTADTIIGNSSDSAITQTMATGVVGGNATGDWVFSIYLRTETGTATVGLQVSSNSEIGTVKNVTINDNWQRYSVVQNFSQANTHKIVSLIVGNNTVVAWGSQLEPSSYARRYSGARTTSLLTTLTTSARIPTSLVLAGTLTGVTSITSSSTITLSRSSIADNRTDGFMAVSSTAATSSIPVRNSPSVTLVSRAWDTSGSGSSKATYWNIDNIPVSGTPLINILRFGTMIEGGNYTYPILFNSNGNITTIGSVGIGTVAPDYSLDIYSGGLRVGDVSGGNYATVESDGINLYGKCRAKKSIFYPARVGIDLEYPLRSIVTDAGINILQLRPDVNEFLHFDIEVPKDIQYSGTGVPRIDIDVFWVNIDTRDDSDWLLFIEYWSSSLSKSFGNEQHNGNVFRISNFPPDPEQCIRKFSWEDVISVNKDGVISLKIGRLGADEGDRLNAPIGIVGVAISYVSDKLGEVL